MNKDDREIQATAQAYSTAAEDLKEFLHQHADVFARFGELADNCNRARTMHLSLLKLRKTSSSLFKMSIPRSFQCPDVEAARGLLGDRFAEFVSLEPRVNTAAVRNAIDAGTIPGLEMMFVEVEGTPRHTGPKEIDLSGLTG